MLRSPLFLAALLLVSGVWLRAQEGHPGADIWRFPDKTYPSTIDGCLRSSGGHYSVTDSAGNNYDLTGSTAWLSRYVGHEVEVTGKPTVITLDTTVTRAASTAEEFPALEVKGAKQIGDRCDPPGGTQR
ncbi:MAG TPA: hypothetical protein VL240_00365 [Candidatus Binatia bacterium]|nr:hypothetical protein [Candidatus Binatia bacterium]